MPDMLFHLSFALLIGVIFKIKNWKLLVTGALLPDFSRILLTLLNITGFNEVKTYLILEPLHTPFICLLLSLSISLLFNNVLKNFLVVYLGVFTHFVLDTMQFAGSFGNLLLYPFLYKQYSLNLFYAGKIIFPIIGIVMLIISLYYLKEKNYLVLNKKFYFSIIPFLLVLVLIFFTPKILQQNNVHSTDFITSPEKYENKEISLYNSKIIFLDPLILNEMGKSFIIEINQKLDLNSKVTIKGIYKNNKIYINNIFFHNYNKEIFSILGILTYLFLLIKDKLSLSVFFDEVSY